MKTHLVFALMAAILLAFVISQSRKKSLTFDAVVAQAEARSREPFAPMQPVDSQVLRGLDYDAYRDIRWRDEFTLWRKQGLTFQAKFFLAGHIHSKPVTIHRVGREAAGPLRFSPEFFDFGKNHLAPADVAKGGYAGFRIHYPINRSDYLDEVLVFLGGSYFRAVAKDLVYGISARGLAIDTTSQEEFPDFTTFWLVEPPPGARTMKIFALLEGASVTGAYEFQVTPGIETRMHVRAVVFPRRDIDGFGVAPLTSMYWFGENTNNTFGDFRPEVHDSDGLQIELGNGEWIWRPLAWSKRLQLALFQDENPRGFGLLQRDRDFSHYQDMEAHYHQRPSVWVRPEGHWGKGAITLLQLPTNNEYMDNVVAFWRPEGGARKGSRVEIAYTLSWFADDPAISPLGRCQATRFDSQDSPYYRLVVLDFAGGELGALPAGAPVSADAWIGANGTIADVQVRKNTETNSWRVSFVASTNQLQTPVELRCSLKLDGRLLTETWTHTWMHE